MVERVLVTGAGGLVGSQVVAALARSGHDVHGCARTPHHAPHLTMHLCNLLDPEAVKLLLLEVRPTILVHCAWVTTHGDYWQSAENLDWVAASLSLVRLARTSGMRRFVGVGTCAEYDAAGEEPKQESRSLVAPATLYGTSKDALRRVVERFAAVESFEFSWARIFMLYGAGEHRDRLIASLARALIAGKPARMSRGAAIRDFLDSRDVGAAIAQLSVSPLQGAVNIGSGRGISLLQIGGTLAQIAGRPELFAPGSVPDRPDEPQFLVADVGRLKNELNFSPSIDLERGLRDALAYWREQPIL
jgi:nucleoside-diphosphate-sugar epimerase